MFSVSLLCAACGWGFNPYLSLASVCVLISDFPNQNWKHVIIMYTPHIRGVSYFIQKFPLLGWNSIPFLYPSCMLIQVTWQSLGSYYFCQLLGLSPVDKTLCSAGCWHLTLASETKWWWEKGSWSGLSSLILRWWSWIMNAFYGRGAFFQPVRLTRLLFVFLR